MVFACATVRQIHLYLSAQPHCYLLHQGLDGSDKDKKKKTDKKKAKKKGKKKSKKSSNSLHQCCTPI